LNLRGNINLFASCKSAFCLPLILRSAVAGGLEPGFGRRGYLLAYKALGLTCQLVGSDSGITDTCKLKLPDGLRDCV